jgi:hypothetical protein
VDPGVGPKDIMPHYIRATYAQRMPFANHGTVDKSDIDHCPRTVQATLLKAWTASRTAQLAAFALWPATDPPSALFIPRLPPRRRDDPPLQHVHASRRIPVVHALSRGGASATSAAAASSSSATGEDDEPDAARSAGARGAGDTAYGYNITLLDLNQLTQLIDAQYSDPEISAIIQYKVDRSLPASWTKQSKDRLEATAANFILLDQSNDRRKALFYLPSAPRRNLKSLVPLVPRLVVPPQFREVMLQAFHDSPFAGHLGIRRMFNRIAVNYYWPSLIQSVIDHVGSCKVCQTEKIQRAKLKVPPGLIEHPTRPFELMSIDFVGPITPPSEGFDHVLDSILTL